MATKRTPIRRDAQAQITEAAIDAFKAMQKAETHEDWVAAYRVLHREMNMPPWEWPCVEDPDAENPYPAGCHAAEHWLKERRDNPQRFELFEALTKAARTRRKR